MARKRLWLAAGLLALVGGTASIQNAEAQVVAPRYAHTATLLPNRNILVVGGLDSSNNPLKSSQLILDDGRVIDTVPLNVARASHTATLLPNGEVLVVGGTGTATAAELASAEVYNPVGSCWHAKVSLQTGSRYDHTASLLKDGTVLVCGGTNGANSLDSCEIFTLNPGNNPADATCAAAAGSFAATGSHLQQARALHTATILPDGRVFFAGGYNPAANPAYLTTTEIYDDETFFSAYPLSQGRALHTATLLGNGKVFIAGGFDGFNALDNDPAVPAGASTDLSKSRGFLRSTEIYDPVADNMVYGATMFVRRMMHPATLKGDGGVVIFGGLGNITDSYITGVTAPLTAGSTVTADCTSLPCTITQPSTQLNFSLKFPLNDVNGALHNVTGVIHNGDLYFTQAPTASGLPPTITFSAGKVTFTPGNSSAESGLSGSMAGATVRCDPLNPTSCGRTEKPYRVLPGNGAGTVTFTPLAVTLQDATLTAGSHLHYDNFLTNCAAQKGDIKSITDGSLIATVTVAGLPPEFVTSPAANVVKATLILAGGTINTFFGADPGFTITIKSAQATNLTGAVSLDPSDPKGGGLVTFNNVSFNSITGTVALSTPSCNPPIGPVSVDGRTLTNATGSLPSYGVDRLNLYNPTSPFNLTADGATAVIRQMSFSDVEEYLPGGAAPNSWKYGSHSFSAQRFGHTSTLNSRGNVQLVGGGSCSPGDWDSASLPSCTVIPVPNGASTTVWGTIHIILEYPFAASTAMGQKRANHTATTLPNGRILIAGGTNGPNIVRAAEIFDPSTHTFSPTGALRDVRDLHTATLLPNGRVLVAGGYSTNATSTGAISGAEIYYPDTGLWIPTTPMNDARSNHTAVLMHDGNVMAIGGYANGVYQDSVEIYYSTAGVWRRTGRLPEGRSLHTATLLQDGRILVVGGEGSSGVLGTTRIYDPRPGGGWTNGSALPGVVVRYHTATLLQDGRVLVAGGNDGHWETANCWMYDPANNGWTQTGSLGVARQNHTATLLPNGMVMAAGGARAIAHGGNPVATVEVFDMSSHNNSWDTWGTDANHGLAGPRAYHTMTVAPDGTLYAIGGYDGTNYLNSTESYFYMAMPDMDSTGYPPSMRLASMTATDLAVFDRGSWLTATGLKFQGVSEASGGGAASANSDHRHPRLILQAVDGSGGGSSQGNSGFILDLTTRIYTNSAVNLWTKTDSSLTVQLPTGLSDPKGAFLLPYGWYQVRAGANDQLSPSLLPLIQAGPPKPPLPVTGITANVQMTHGVSTITFTWTPPTGSVNWDGYNIYAAPSKIWIATVAATANPSITLTGLGAGSTRQILVAPFNISGDGPIAASTSTTIAYVTGLGGAGFSPTTIQWSWDPVSASNAHYNVYNATSGAIIATQIQQNSYLEINLATNSANSIFVSAITDTGEGPLSDPATVYTWAAPPALSSLAMDIANSSITAYWQQNGNPVGTTYDVRSSSGYVAGAAGAATMQVTSVATTTMQATIGNLPPAAIFTLDARAFSSAGTPTSWTLLGSTATKANPPANLTVTGTSPSSISVAWDTNGNASATYEVAYSTAATDQFDQYANTVIPFSQGFSGNACIVTGLLTSTTYTIRVRARNPLGVVTAPAFSLSTLTYSGGAPLGSLGGTVSAQQNTIISGSVGLLNQPPPPRQVWLNSPANSFPSDTTLTISTRDASGGLCANGDPALAFSVSASPALQPVRPLYFTVAYNPATELLGVPANRITMMRYDPVGNSCVPLATAVDAVNHTITGQLNHLSLFQIGQWLPSSKLDSTIIFPNPFYAERDGLVTLKSMPASARVRIYTLRGELVFDQLANASGLLMWRGTNRAGRAVASGVYFVVIESGDLRSIQKLAVIR